MFAEFFNSELLLAIVVYLLSLVPTIGGAVGGVISLLVDVIKAIFHIVLKGRTAPPGMWGFLVLVLNVIFVVGLWFVIGQNPLEVELPADVEGYFQTAITVFSAILTILMALATATLTHKEVVKKAPTVFSSTVHRMQESGASSTSKQSTFNIESIPLNMLSENDLIKLVGRVSAEINNRTIQRTAAG